MRVHPARRAKDPVTVACRRWGDASGVVTNLIEAHLAAIADPFPMPRLFTFTARLAEGRMIPTEAAGVGPHPHEAARIK